MLEAVGLDRFDSDEFTALVQEKKSVRVPKEPEARDAFFDYLKAIGAFDDMITVNSRSLNAWYKEQEANSEALEFRVPGIEPPTVYTEVSLRKRR